MDDLNFLCVNLNQTEIWASICEYWPAKRIFKYDYCKYALMWMNCTLKKFGLTCLIVTEIYYYCSVVECCLKAIITLILNTNNKTYY